MSKYLPIKAVALALLAFVATCAHDARAGEVVTNETFVSGTSFENFDPGWFWPVQSDDGNLSGPYHWAASASASATSTEVVDQVVAYLPGLAYDYATNGLSRSAYLDLVEPSTNRYLLLSAEEDLHRAIFASGQYSPTNDFTNLIVRTGSRESIYCDLLTRFYPDDGEAVQRSNARLLVWASLKTTNVVDELKSTNLVVTAGFFTNGFLSAVSRDYVLDTSAICTNGFDVTRWYRLTIRNHGDVSANGTTGLGGFSLYLDGQPLRAVEDGYEIWDSATARPSWLNAEARALWRDRRLFPSLAAPGSDAAFTMSGITFVGAGLIDDITFSSSDSPCAPAYGRPEAVFTLNWDAGIKALEYTFDGGLTTNAAPVGTATSRTADILLGNAATNGMILKVTKCVYDEAHGFMPGVWFGSNGATLTNDTEFVYDGTNKNPTATLTSTRETIDIDPGNPAAYDSFQLAIRALDLSTNKVKTIRLMTNVVVGVRNGTSVKTSDLGSVRFDKPDGEYELDLNGHTLQGTNSNAAASTKPGAETAKYPTLAVMCKSLRIYDSSEPDPVTKLRSGRILPIGSYTNADERMNTAVAIYPRMESGTLVEPTLTIEDGTYDGWVRNKPKLDLDEPLVGTVIVEAGRFIATNNASFYLESSVTNPLLIFAWKDNYWSVRGETNLIVWTGLGDGRRWVDPDNWRTHRLPTSTETAFFPYRGEGVDPWTVDVEDGQMTTTDLLLEHDVYLSGTNEFKNVKARSDWTGLFCGDATLVYEGEQPGALVGTLLRDDWAGTVLLRNVGYPTTKAAKVLKNMETWGTETSTVEFNGVRGYVSDKVSHTLPYDLVLRDFVTTSSGKVTTNQAWRNDSGYTGSTLAFTGALLGDGTLQCGKALKPIYQIIKFADVANYTGRFDIKGKRVLVGNDCELTIAEGLIAFGNPAVVRADLGWTSRYATFSDTLFLMGQTNSVVVTTTAAEPNVLTCSTLYLKCAPGSSYVPGVAWLASTNDPKYTVYVTGVPRPEDETDENDPNAVAAALPAAALLNSTLSSPLFASASSSGYASAALQAAGQEVAQAAVDNADVTLVVDEDTVYVVITGTDPNFWYGVRTRTSLAAEWSPPTKWLRPTGSTTTLECPKEGDGESCFYSVVVSYEDPNSSGGGSE